MSGGPNAEGLHLPPHGYRRRGLVTAEALPPEPVRTGWMAELQRWEDYRITVWVLPDGGDRPVDHGRGEARDWASQPEEAAKLLRTMRWELVAPWEAWRGQALRAPVRRIRTGP